MKRGRQPAVPPVDVDADAAGAAPRPRRSDAELEIRVNGTLIARTPEDVAESLRFLLAQVDRLPRCFSVTSAVHGEGVTLVSRSLAALIAHDRGTTVCWVDLNWWKRAAAATAEQWLVNATVADYLSGVCVASDLPKATSVPGLSIVLGGMVPVGRRPHVALSEALATLINELRLQFGIVVLDLPPALVTSDALNLARLGDGCFLVVRQRATSSVEVRRAARSLETVGLLGTVLNGSSSRVPKLLRRSQWSEL